MRELYRMKGVVISPPHSQGIVAVSFNPNTGDVFGYRLADGTEVCVDAKTGIVSIAQPWQRVKCRDRDWTLKFGFSDKPTNYGFKTDPILTGDVPDLPDEVIDLVCRMVEQRVKADEIEKGLRAQGFEDVPKIVQNFVSGYQVKGGRKIAASGEIRNFFSSLLADRT